MTLPLFSGPNGKCAKCGAQLHARFEYCESPTTKRDFTFNPGHRSPHANGEAMATIWTCNPTDHQGRKVIHRFCFGCGAAPWERPLDEVKTPRDIFLVEVSRLLRLTQSELAEDLVRELERRLPADVVEEKPVVDQRHWFRRLFLAEKS